MQQLSAITVLEVWERGAGSSPADRALLVLDRCGGEYNRESLLDLTVGQRDRLLLQVYRQTFGDALEAFAGCPSCQERLEFSLSCGALLSESPQPDSAGVAAVTIVTRGGDQVYLRSPNCRDLASAAASESVEAARRVLLRGCATLASGGDIETLPQPAQAEIAEQLAALDPQAELLAKLVCPACGATWQSVLEVIQFLWAGIGVRARRLLQEVDALARVYGWREADILAMSDTRRRLYLHMALS